MADALIDLTDIATCRDHLDIPVLNTDQDARIERFITSASRRIQSFCDRRFVQQTYTELQHGSRTNSIMLKHFPADKPTEVNIDQSSVFGVDTVVDPSEYNIHHDSLLVMVDGRTFPKGVQNIKVIYQAGYATLPDDITDATIWLVEFLFDMREARRIGELSKSKGGESVSWVNTMPESIKEAIMPYKRLEFPTSNLPILNY